MLAVTQSCFFTKDALSVGFVCRWLEQNCPRLILPLHRYCVHTITTVYRRFETDPLPLGNLPNQTENATNDEDTGITIVAGQQQKSALELATPVLDNINNPFESTSGQKRRSPHLMPLSQAWLLAGALPAIYTRPQQTVVPRTDHQQQRNHSELSPSSPTSQPSTAGLKSSVNGSLGGSNASTTFMNRLLSIVPSHWTLLYDSQQHGVGSNRFLHHVLGYRGPTLILLHSKTDELFCIAAPGEWRETHLYTGEKECQIMQLLPKYASNICFSN